MTWGVILIAEPLFCNKNLKWMNCFISVQVEHLWITFYKISPTGERARKVYSDLLILKSSLIINASILLILVLCDQQSIYWWSVEKMARYSVSSTPFISTCCTTLLTVKNTWIIDTLFSYMLCCHSCLKSLYLTSCGREVICGILNRRYLRAARPFFVKMMSGQWRHFEKVDRSN